MNLATGPEHRARIFKLLWSPGIDFNLAGRYDNPIPLRFQAPIDSLKIPAQSADFLSPLPLGAAEAGSLYMNK
jgi:hypothetical protein